MLERILALFPPHTHPLTLVSDPDGVLADETALPAAGVRAPRPSGLCRPAPGPRLGYGAPDRRGSLAPD